MDTKPCRRCGGVMRETTAAQTVTIAGLAQPVAGFVHWQCPDCGAEVETPDQIDANAALVADMRAADRLIAGALAQTRRRLRVCSQASCCPKCKTRQVQLMDCRLLASWRCRHCRHRWTYEPLVVEKQG